MSYSSLKTQYYNVNQDDICKYKRRSRKDKLDLTKAQCGPQVFKLTKHVFKIVLKNDLKILEHSSIEDSA